MPVLRQKPPLQVQTNFHNHHAPTREQLLSEPLREDGTIDYVKAIDQLHAEDVTTENNACVLLVRAFGPELYGDNKLEALKRLGIPNLPDDGDYLIQLKDYLIEQGIVDPEADTIAYEDYMDAIEKPWNETDHPGIAKWLNKHDPQIELFVAASRKSHFYSPLMTSEPDGLAIEVLLPMMQEIRSAARMLSCRAMLRCASGDANGAMEDAMAIIRLSRLTDHHPFLIGRLVSYALSSVGNQAVAEILATNQLTSDQIQKFANEHRDLPETSSITETFNRGERYTSLDAALGYYRGRAPTDFGLPESSPLAQAMDINVVMRLFNQRYDDIIEAVETLDREELTKFQHEYTKEVRAKGKLRFSAMFSQLYGSNKGASEIMGNNLFALLLPSFSQSLNAELRTRVREDLVEGLFALAQYRAEHGTYPTTLEELVPNQLSAIPTDRFSNGPIQYQLNESGEFLIYSVGDNGIDDGGVMELATDKDDIAYGAIPEIIEPEVE